MKPIKKQKGNQEVSYWSSMVDLMSALLMLILLIFILVLLYIIQAPREEYEDLFPGDTYEDDWDGAYAYDRELQPTTAPEHLYDEPWHDNSSGGGGGGSGGDGDVEETPYQYEYPETLDEGDKCAVHVTLLDGETEQVIEKEGIAFQLLAGKSVVQVLRTYYPEIIEYSRYETTEQGVFYLPEKIPFGEYFLEELTEPFGYDASENVQVSVKEALDWPQPLEVEVRLFPSRNIICLQMKDADSGENVKGAVYEVIAAEDIITLDGTLRYEKNQVVDQIVLNEDGYGESGLLYLGQYKIVQTVIPEYYVGEKEPGEIDLPKKGTAEDLPKTITAQKTKVICYTFDELYQDIALKDVQYELSIDGRERQLLTPDASGALVISDLKKNVEYTLHQTAAQDGYLLPDHTVTFTVAEDGTVDGEARRELEMTNRMIRISVGTLDKLLGTHASDYSITLCDDQGQRVHFWTSTAVSEKIEGIQPGHYELFVNGKSDKRIGIEVEDVSEIQNFEIRVWSPQGLGTLGCILAVACLAGLLTVIKVRQMKRK